MYVEMGFQPNLYQQWLLMKLWQKPYSLLLCIMIRCSLKTVLLHEASVGLHQTTIHSLDLPVHTKWNMWICMYSICDMYICMSSFWLYTFFVCSNLWYVGNDWNHQFSGRLLTSKWKFKKKKESYLAKIILQWCSWFAPINFKHTIVVPLLKIQNEGFSHAGNQGQYCWWTQFSWLSQLVWRSQQDLCSFCCWNVGSQFAFWLLFLSYYFHSSQSSPAPYASYVPDVIYSDLTYNRDLIVSYCIHREIGTTGMFD